MLRQFITIYTLFFNINRSTFYQKTFITNILNSKKPDPQSISIPRWYSILENECHHNQNTMHLKKALFYQTYFVNMFVFIFFFLIFMHNLNSGKETSYFIFSVRGLYNVIRQPSSAHKSFLWTLNNDMNAVYEFGFSTSTALLFIH